MCAQYDAEMTPGDLEKYLRKIWGLDRPAWKTRIVPYAKAPVAVGDHLELMQYSLVPSWSKEPKVKFATYNARLDTILEKATWKRPFTKHHCVVPLSRFVEPIYTGKLAGNMVAFRAPELLLAAGIYDEWKNPETGEILKSFALVTDDPSDYVKEIGHDRQPVFLSQKRAEDWLNNEKQQGEELRTFLKEGAEEPNFTTEIDRPMAKGWEKRIPKD